MRLKYHLRVRYAQRLLWKSSVLFSAYFKTIVNQKKNVKNAVDKTRLLSTTKKKKNASISSFRPTIIPAVGQYRQLWYSATVLAFFAELDAFQNVHNDQHASVCCSLRVAHYASTTSRPARRVCPIYAFLALPAHGATVSRRENLELVARATVLWLVTRNVIGNRALFDWNNAGSKPVSNWLKSHYEFD